MPQHKERVLFLIPHTGVYQLSHDYHNVYYYHARNACVYTHFNDFCADIHIKVDRSVQLSEERRNRSGRPGNCQTNILGLHS